MEYQMTPDIREKEKIVGGHFTLTQTIFLALAVISGGGLGILTYNTLDSIPVAIIVVIIGAIPFLPFAFIKVEKMGDKELFFYLLIKFQHNKGQKVYLNINENKKKRILEENDNEFI